MNNSSVEGALEQRAQVGRCTHSSLPRTPCPVRLQHRVCLVLHPNMGVVGLVGWLVVIGGRTAAAYAADVFRRVTAGARDTLCGSVLEYSCCQGMMAAHN